MFYSDSSSSSSDEVSPSSSACEARDVTCAMVIAKAFSSATVPRMDKLLDISMFVLQTFHGGLHARLGD